MVIPCFPKKQAQQPEEELNAFDLTWRNYLPSASQFCCCLPSTQAIRLEDDPLIEPAYYNDHTLYRGEPIHNYSNSDFDSVLGGQNDPSRFVTRNPFGKPQKKKKSSKNKKKHRHHKPVVMETDMEEDGQSEFITGYDINNQSYYNDDAEFLGDDQIANLAYNRHSNQMMDQYGEELYYQEQQYIQGPIEQEMQAPSQRKEFYAARTMPTHLMQPAYIEEEEEEEQGSSRGTTKPQYATEAAQALLSERLDDLTEKLAFIKNNIINIKPSQKQEERDPDTNTLHTIHRQEEEESISDIDSITSEALDAYENTTNNTEQPSSSSSVAHHQTRRFSANELHLPSFADNTPFVSDQHPFTYFTDHSSSSQQEQQQEQNNNNENRETDEDDDNVLNVKNVLNLGRKWFGV